MNDAEAAKFVPQPNGANPVATRLVAELKHDRGILACRFDPTSHFLFAGARDLLDELAAVGYLLGVATGKTRVGLDRALAAHALHDRFHATRCADEGRPKPHPDMLLHLLRDIIKGVSDRVQPVIVALGCLLSCV